MLSAYQSEKSFLCSPVEISYADFTDRTLTALYHILKNGKNYNA